MANKARTKATQPKPVMLRVEVDYSMHQWLKEYAKETERTVQGCIRVILREARSELDPAFQDNGP